MGVSIPHEERVRNDDLRAAAVEGYQGYRKAMVRAGLLRNGQSLEDLDSVIIDLVNEKNKLEQLQKDFEIALQVVEMEQTRLRAMRDEVLRSSDPLASAAIPETLTKRILKEVCQKHGVNITDVKSEKRQTPIVRARQEICYRLYYETTHTLPTIGRLLGNRDHTTIKHGRDKHEKRMKAAKQ